LIKSRRIGLEGQVSRIGEKRNADRILVGMPEGKIPLKRSKRRWVDNIKMGLKGIVCGDMYWIDLARDRYRRRALAISVMDFQIP
jgi:hypothetical protein